MHLVLRTRPRRLCLLDVCVEADVGPAGAPLGLTLKAASFASGDLPVTFSFRGVEAALEVSMGTSPRFISTHDMW